MVPVRRPGGAGARECPPRNTRFPCSAMSACTDRKAPTLTGWPCAACDLKSGIAVTVIRPIGCMAAQRCIRNWSRASSDEPATPYQRRVTALHAHRMSSDSAGPTAVLKNCLIGEPLIFRLMFLSNVVAYPCRHSLQEDRHHVQQGDRHHVQRSAKLWIPPAGDQRFSHQRFAKTFGKLGNRRNLESQNHRNPAGFLAECGRPEGLSPRSRLRRTNGTAPVRPAAASNSNSIGFDRRIIFISTASRHYS
jgi:hypothetical protein